MMQSLLCIPSCSLPGTLHYQICHWRWTRSCSHLLLRVYVTDFATSLSRVFSPTTCPLCRRALHWGTKRTHPRYPGSTAMRAFSHSGPTPNTSTLKMSGIASSSPSSSTRHRRSPVGFPGDSPEGLRCHVRGLRRLIGRGPLL
jgi:hypothetical protein